MSITSSSADAVTAGADAAATTAGAADAADKNEYIKGFDLTNNSNSELHSILGIGLPQHTYKVIKEEEEGVSSYHIITENNIFTIKIGDLEKLENMTYEQADSEIVKALESSDSEIFTQVAVNRTEFKLPLNIHKTFTKDKANKGGRKSRRRRRTRKTAKKTVKRRRRRRTKRRKTAKKSRRRRRRRRK